MALRIPQNQIITSKYTSGREYLVEKTHQVYKGYYYELNNKTYAGKVFDINAPILIKFNSDNVNELLINPATRQYGFLSGIKINKYPPIPSIPFDGEEKTRYFFKKQTDNNPIIIKETTKDAFDQLQLDPQYQTISVEFRYYLTDTELNILNIKMPGIKLFLQDDLFPNPPKDETNPYIG